LVSEDPQIWCEPLNGRAHCAWTLVESSTDTGAEMQTWADCSGRKVSIPLKKDLEPQPFPSREFCACDRESDATPIERSGVAFSGNIRERYEVWDFFSRRSTFRSAVLT